MSFPPAPPESSPRRRGRGLVLVVVAVMLLGAGAGVYGAGRALLGYEAYSMPSEHMSPTLKPGDRLVVRRAAGAEVHRGDLVVVAGTAFACPR
ncbi:S26 family signal peptidase [Amycolatopsis sp. NPDC003861]